MLHAIIMINEMLYNFILVPRCVCLCVYVLVREFMSVVAFYDDKCDVYL